MSKQEKRMVGAMRIFEALSGVEEELLVRCEEEEVKKKAPVWYYGKVLAACLCFVVMGVVLWSLRPIMDTAMDTSGNTKSAPATVIETPRAAMEEAACENEIALEGVADQNDAPAERDNGSGTSGVGEAGTQSNGLKDAVMESQIEDTETVKQETTQQEIVKPEAEKQEAVSNAQSAASESLNDSKENGITDMGTSLDKRKKLSLKDAEAVAVLGEYVPAVVPAGYIFESAYLTESNTTGKAEGISLCWVNGMDDIRINISYAAEDAATVDVSKTETYDVHQYEIPYASTVPEEYRVVFHNPVFAEADFTQDIVKMRMKVVADAGDTDTPRGSFGILYDSGVLVEFNGDGDAESVYEMMVSIK